MLDMVHIIMLNNLHHRYYSALEQEYNYMIKKHNRKNDFILNFIFFYLTMSRNTRSGKTTTKDNDKKNG